MSLGNVTDKVEPIVYAISYGDDNFSMSRSINLWTAKWIGGANYVKEFGPKNLEKDFLQENHNILSKERGGGYWLWKPYIILKMLEEVQEGDFIFYTDAGMIYVNKIKKLIYQLNQENNDIFLSLGFAPVKDWCKRDTFILMGCDNEYSKSQVMVSGGYILLRKSKKSLEFIRKWLKYSCDERILTDCPNRCGKPNAPSFKEHRHDQAILTNLKTLYGIEGYKAVSHVDEPREHIEALKKKALGAYGYSFEQRIELMSIEHKLHGYKCANYSRIFINTRIRNCKPILFFFKLIHKIFKSIYKDLWGFFNDQKYLKDKSII